MALHMNHTKKHAPNSVKFTMRKQHELQPQNEPKLKLMKMRTKFRECEMVFTTKGKLFIIIQSEELIQVSYLLVERR